MRCPNCDYGPYSSNEPCPQCRFNGDPALIDELAHVDWVLAEMDTWQMLPEKARQFLYDRYNNRQYELEVQLGLRLPRFSAVEAQQAWPELVQRERLLARTAEWLAAGLVDAAAAEKLRDQVRDQVEDLLEQLEGYARPAWPETGAERLELAGFLIEAIDHLNQKGGFVTAAAHDQALAPLLLEQKTLEQELGRRVLAPEPQPDSSGAAGQPAAEGSPAGELLPEAVLEPPVRIPPVPPVPLLERVWRTLLSERTLQALLFLGIFLLFSAALSFVIWGWQDFSAPLRVAIPTGFTTVFFIMGWVVRTRTHLYHSGIALSAIAALLIPIDFYTVYVNFNVPADAWPLFWFITSLLCFIAYLVITLIIRSRFFGYLVGTAMGSIVLALIEMGHQAFDLSLDWRTAGLSGLAAGLVLLAASLSRARPKKRVPGAEPRASYREALAEPFRYLALFTVGALMPLTFGWRYIDRNSYDTLHTALTITWWLGSLIFGWAAVHYRSRSLGYVAALALPVAAYLAEAALFDRFSLHPAWYALGWALLVPGYFLVGSRLLRRTDDLVLYLHGRTATRVGVALLIVATLWSLTNLSNEAAAASSHVVLAGAVVLAAWLWRRPTYLYGASALFLSAVTFAMSELQLTIAQLSVGWASLAIAHFIAALRLGTRFPTPSGQETAEESSVRAAEIFIRPLVVAGYAIAGLALLPPLYPYDSGLLAYTLGNWLGLAAWGARLVHQQQPGFAGRGFWRKPVFHWFTALPLPVWLGILVRHLHLPDFSLPLVLSAVAWGMITLSYRFHTGRAMRAYRWPWYLTGLLVSLAAAVTAFTLAPQGFTPAVVLLVVGLLYLVDAVVYRQSWELAPAGLVIAWGYLLLLQQLQVSFDAASFGLALLITVYFLAGLGVERRTHRAIGSDPGWKGFSDAPARLRLHFDRRFLIPWYVMAHVLLLVLLWRIYLRPLEQMFAALPWSAEMRLWGAASQMLVGLVYGLYAWATHRERWGHLAAWLLAAGGGFVAITYSHGRGSSAAWAALMAIAFVLAERGLYGLRHYRGQRLTRRQHAFFRFTWSLYRRPLLITGWALSGAAILLAFLRNLWLLGGGRIQLIWAAAGLALVVALYAISARLFRRAGFVGLAAPLLLAPWTILTYLGWFTPYRPTLPGYGLSWTILAWLLLLAGLVVIRRTPARYGLPLKVTAHLLLPLALLWGIADGNTSRFTFGLALAFYSLLALLEHRRLVAEPAIENPAPDRLSGRLKGTRFLYPALGLIPAWSVYLMGWLLPAARHESYGLLLLAFGPLGLLAGQLLERNTPRRELAGAYGLPAYLTGYFSVLVGTLLVAHIPALLSLTLLFDAGLLLASARLFRHPLWVYPAAGLAPLSLLLALGQAGIPVQRYGWWLIGLASIYLLLAWALRRTDAPVYGGPPLAAGFALIALALPFSSLDQTGASWGYGSAALLYGLAAFWLRQPLLLTPACSLALVPYAIVLQRSGLPAEYYGLALFPGAVTALVIGASLDRFFGRWSGFPWARPAKWPAALTSRLLGWWGLPFYGLGFGMALASPFFANLQPGLVSLNFFLLMLLFGWAVYSFRLPGWLLAAAVAGHFAAVFLLEAGGWWLYPAWAWFRFLPVTLVTAGVAWFIERRYREEPPRWGVNWWVGWSRPLYLLVILDIMIGQFIGVGGTWPGAAVSLVHALLIAFFASAWLSPGLAYLSAALGVISLSQWWLTWNSPVITLPVVLARLALLYGLAGYGLALLRDRLKETRELRPWLAIWEVPLQRSSLGLSWGTLVLTAALGFHVFTWTARALLGLPFRQIIDVAVVQMVTGVLAQLGLLYVAVAFTHRWVRLGYVAYGMLLVAWLLHAFYVQQWDGVARIQWYAIPAGFYLLGVGYLEWRRGNRVLARWLDYGAMLLMLGSLFWQTMLFGWTYAFLLGAEGFASFWWGSARRLRRFFYAGMLGVVLATLGQLINSLRSINQWLVFGGIGLLLVLVAIIVERKLEEIKAWQQEVLESWE